MLIIAAAFWPAWVTQQVAGTFGAAPTMNAAAGVTSPAAATFTESPSLSMSAFRQTSGSASFVSSPALGMTATRAMLGSAAFNARPGWAVAALGASGPDFGGAIGLTEPILHVIGVTHDTISPRVPAGVRGQG